MNSVNNLYEIINDKNKTEPNSIYDELKQKEDKYYDTINRVIDYKLKEEEQNTYFQYTTIQNFIINIFITLNVIFKELMNTNLSKINNSDLLKIFTKDHRLIYVGIILIFLALIMLLIDISDS
jgi:hypothetical protein